MRSVALLLFFTVVVISRSDLVECANGDRYNGKVLLVDEHNVKIQNEITGVLSIPRSKVSTITFGQVTPAQRAGTGVPAARTNLLSPTQPLQIDPAAVEQVQNQLLGDASPEATQMFQEMVRNLMSGKMDVADVRAKAQSTLDELKDLQKELGDDETAALLGSYASILENFVKQAPARTNSLPSQTPSVQ